MSGRRRAAGVPVVVVATVLSLLGQSEATYADLTFTTLGGRPFSETSFVNVPIPREPALDPNSASVASFLGAPGVYRYAQIYDSGVPVWNADASTRRYTITCTRPWGTCPFNGHLVPIPDNAGTNNNADKPMVVVDFRNRRSYEFFEFQRDASGIRTGWGAVSDIDGQGIPLVGNAVAAGISRLAGLVRTYEIGQGRIDHALTFLSDNSCAGRYRYPAQKTDGDSYASNCIEQGSRIQLDPSINVDAIPNITQFERIVAKALQTYGAYVQDKATFGTGSRMTFWFEPPAPGEVDPYKAAGVPWDWWHMPNIPWSRIRVLKDWTGNATATTTTTVPTSTSTTVAPSTTTTTVPPTTDTTAPSAPGNLGVTSFGRTNVDLAWSASTDNVGVTGYRIWRATDANLNGAWNLVASVSGSTLTFSDTTVSRRTKYYYGIRAVDARGNVSASSNIVIVKTA